MLPATLGVGSRLLAALRRTLTAAALSTLLLPTLLSPSLLLSAFLTLLTVMTLLPGLRHLLHLLLEPLSFTPQRLLPPSLLETLRTGLGAGLLLG